MKHHDLLARIVDGAQGMISVLQAIRYTPREAHLICSLAAHACGKELKPDDADLAACEYVREMIDRNNALYDKVLSGEITRDEGLRLAARDLECQ